LLELEARGTAFIRFNTEDYPVNARIVWRPEGGSLELQDRSVSLKQVRSIWYRRPVRPELPDDLSSERQAWITNEAMEGFRGLWRSFQGLWVNNPDANDLASSKLEQLTRASRLGLSIPRSLMTNKSEELAPFARHSSSGVICKPLQTGYTDFDGIEGLFFTSLLSERDIEDFAADWREPYLFQHLVDKAHDVRVTVIGESVFAVRIESQDRADARIDWRRGDQSALRHQPIDLPSDVAQRSLALVRSYDLTFGALDFAIDHAGNYVFFELNPNGQWAWLEQMTGLPMRSALADVLETAHD